MEILEIKYFTDQESFNAENLKFELSSRKTDFFNVYPNPGFNCRAIDFDPEQPDQFEIYFYDGQSSVKIPRRCVYDVDAIGIEVNLIEPN
ncbi:hypothetical protein [Leptospira bouyouniensis]|uniref:Uncharacterized protein n=1 Tax=Leptospira bouyouniensis TaxID=2484911 RepID=A0ABY2KZ40_9LEPT|nr:hypothetical protein [Leptospira bouyouniensis]TGK45528.1 hypothetical protein EHQ10_18955 [Leptospira bouyouniensis]